jgi:hypothetical protein
MWSTLTLESQALAALANSGEPIRGRNSPFRRRVRDERSVKVEAKRVSFAA